MSGKIDIIHSLINVLMMFTFNWMFLRSKWNKVSNSCTQTHTKQKKLLAFLNEKALIIHNGYYLHSVQSKSDDFQLIKSHYYQRHSTSRCFFPNKNDFHNQISFLRRTKCPTLIRWNLRRFFSCIRLQHDFTVQIKYSLRIVISAFFDF